MPVASEVGELITNWDEADVVEEEVKYRFENQESPGELNEDEIRRSVLEDEDFTRQMWEDMLAELTEAMKLKNKGVYWRAEVENFGWRSLSGHKVFKAENGSEFLHGILPKTDCRFKVFYCGKGIAVQNWHHDSPVGKEWYRVMPISEEKFLEGGS